MHIKESSLLRDAIKQYQQQSTIHQQSNQSFQNQDNNRNNQANSNTVSRNINIGSNNYVPTTSPQNDPPPPSPASSIGSTNSNTPLVYGSTNSSQNSQEISSILATSLNNNIASSTLSVNSSNSTKLANLYEKFFKITESNVKSQMIWESNENQISEIKFLTGNISRKFNIHL